MDSLSRGLVDPVVDWGMPTEKVFDLKGNKSIIQLVQMCNPSLSPMDWAQTVNLWEMVSTWINWSDEV
jgi:hypothetical protein